jgi:hypothetical protein
MLATTPKGLYKPVRTRLGELPFHLSKKGVNPTNGTPD